MHHSTIKINHQPEATVFQSFYPDVHLQLNIFRAFSRPSSGAQWLQWQPLVLPSYRGDSRAVFVVGPARTRPAARLPPLSSSKTRSCYCSHVLLMMSGRKPETCWAVDEGQDNKLENCCFLLVIYLNENDSSLIKIYFHFCTVYMRYTYT